MATATKKKKNPINDVANATIEGETNMSNTTPTVEQLLAQLNEANAKIAELSELANKPKRAPKSDEEKAAAEAKKAFKTVTYEDEDSTVGKVQRLERGNQLSAIAKAVRLLPYDTTARIAVEMAERVAESTGRDLDSVLAETTAKTERKAKADKADDAASEDSDLSDDNGADAE